MAGHQDRGDDFNKRACVDRVLEEIPSWLIGNAAQRTRDPLDIVSQEEKERTYEGVLQGLRL